MRCEGFFLAGVGAYIAPVVSIVDAIKNGLYVPAATGPGDGWVGAAVEPTLSAPEMAVVAAREAIRRSGHATADINLVMHSSLYHQGPDLWPASFYIQRQAVANDAMALELRIGCTGMINAMEMAVAYLTIDPRRTAALITGADNFGTSAVNRWSYGPRMRRGSILGDGAAALVLSRRPGPLRLLAVAGSAVSELEELYRGDEPLFPPGCTVGRPADFATRLASYDDLDDRIAHAIKLVDQARTDLVRRTLAEAGVAVSEVTRVTHVSAGTRQYLESVIGPLGIDPDRGMLEFGRHHGHMGVSDQVAGLNHLMETGAIGPGDRVLLLSNGAGVGVACAVVEVVDPPVPAS